MARSSWRREGAAFKVSAHAAQSATFADFVREHNNRAERARMSQPGATIGREGGSSECPCTNPYCQV